MAAISGKAAGGLQNKSKFNSGNELEEELGVHFYSTFFRKYDAQIGRFNGIDIRSSESASLSIYQFSVNNPVSFNDPLGDKQVQIKESDPISRSWNLDYKSNMHDWSSADA